MPRHCIFTIIFLLSASEHLGICPYKKAIESIYKKLISCNMHSKQFKGEVLSQLVNFGEKKKSIHLTGAEILP